MDPKQFDSSYWSYLGYFVIGNAALLGVRCSWSLMHYLLGLGVFIGGWLITAGLILLVEWLSPESPTEPYRPTFSGQIVRPTLGAVGFVWMLIFHLASSFLLVSAGISGSPNGLRFKLARTGSVHAHGLGDMGRSKA
jgi:hypothetical protein